MLGPCTAREHNQLCPLYNHTTTTTVLAVHTLSELMYLQEILLVKRWYHRLCVHFWSGELLREKQFLAHSSKCLFPTLWMKTVCSRKTGRCEFLSLPLLRIIFASAKEKIIMLLLKMRWMLRLTWVGGKDFTQDEAGDKPALAKTNSCRDVWKKRKEKGPTALLFK